MPRALSRVLLTAVLVCGGALALIGALAVRGPGVIGIGLAAVLAGCTAAGVAREAPAPGRASAVEFAVRAAGGTVVVLLVVAGIATVGGTIAAVVAVAAAVAVVGVQIVRRPPRSGGTGTGPRRPATGTAPRLPDPTPIGLVGLPPAASSTTRALGDEWLRTTAALGTRLTPSARAALVSRREEVLDELERRDPSGFALWLAAGPARGGDPADFVQGGPARSGPVPDADAA